MIAFSAMKPGAAVTRGALVFLLALLPFFPVDGQAANTAVLKAKCANKVEQLAQAMIPQEKLNRAMGFFGPVTKKYLPVYEKFSSEYQATSNKIVVVKKYLPKADAALAEAKKMKVPAKYEAEKAEYIQMAEGFLMMTKLTVRLGQ